MNRCQLTTLFLREKVKYKPNVAFAFDCGGDRIICHMQTSTDDARKPGSTEQGYTAVYVYEPHSPERLRLFLREMVRRFELHEVDEWLMVDGKRLHDPHAPNTDPDPQDTTP